MKKTPALTLVVLFGVASFSPLYSQFKDGKTASLRLIGGYARSTNNPSSGGGVAGFALAGTKWRVHELNFEATFGKWETALYDEVSGEMLEFPTERHFQFLLNYRYYIPVGDSNFAFHAGGGIGAAVISGKPNTDAEREAAGDVPFWDSDGDGFNDNPDAMDLSGPDRWVFAAAATAGFVIKSDDRISIDISYRCLWESALYYDIYYSYDKATQRLYDRRTYRNKEDLIHMVLLSFRLSL